MNPINLAYAAGAIDADGYISIHKTKKSNGRLIYHSAILGLTNTSPLVPELLKKQFGGRVNQHQPKNPKHKRWYMWTADGSIAYKALLQLQYYLILKKNQAKLVIEFFEVCQKQKPQVLLNGNRLSEEIVAVRDHYWSLVGRCNQPRNRRVHFDHAETGHS